MAVALVVAGAGPRGLLWMGEVRDHPGFELAACVDPDREALERAGEAHGVPATRRFAGLEEALAEVAADAAIVATPADRHVEACELALSRGLGVLVEKPFALRLAEAVGVVRLAEERGAPLLVGQNLRYTRAHRTVRRLVREGAIGRVGMAVAHYYHTPDHLPPSHAAMTNSVLWGPVVHHMDALRYTLGSRVTGVVAQTFTTPWGPLPDGASLQAMLTLEGDVHATYTATYESKGHERFEGGQEFYERLVGERATLHVLNRWLVLCEPGRHPRWIRRGRRPRTEESILLNQLERALRDDSEPDASGRDNLETVATMEACLISASEGRWVDPGELLREAGAERAPRD